MKTDSGDRRKIRSNSPRAVYRRRLYHQRKALSICPDCKKPVLRRVRCFDCTDRCNQTVSMPAWVRVHPVNVRAARKGY